MRMVLVYGMKHPTQFDHQWGIDIHHANIEVDEVSSKEYDASYIDNVVESSVILLSGWTKWIRNVTIHNNK